MHNIRDISKNFERVVKHKLSMIKEKEDCILTKYWKGYDYYYHKLFKHSIHIEHLNIPKDILKKRYEWNFEAMICGHPKASNGWFCDVQKEIEELMTAFKNNSE